MKWELHKDHKGFTLIELLVSVAILAFVVAPFLGVFVAAGESNVKSNRKQQATDIGQLLAEEIKAKDFELLQKDYNLIKKEEVIDGGSKRIVYEADSVDTNFMKSYGGSYTAKVRFEPADVTANNDKITPVIDTANGGNMAVFMKNIYIDDADAIDAGATRRQVTFTIDYDDNRSTGAVKLGVYTVEMRVQYFDDSDTEITIPSATAPKVLEYLTIPNLYILYKPFITDRSDLSGTVNMEDIDDAIIIKNLLTHGDGSPGSVNELEKGKLKVYIAEQEFFARMNPNNIRLQEYRLGSGGVKELKNETPLLDIQSAATDNVYENGTTQVFTNCISDAIPDAEKEAKENLVHVEKNVTLYNVVIEIYMGGKLVDTVTTTKNIGV